MDQLNKLNRFGVTLKPTEKCLKWINALPNTTEPFELDDIDFDCTLILLPYFKNQHELDDFIKEKYNLVFEHELASWEEDHTLWPQDRTFENFQEMFDLEYSTSVYEIGQVR